MVPKNSAPISSLTIKWNVMFNNIVSFWIHFYIIIASWMSYRSQFTAIVISNCCLLRMIATGQWWSLSAIAVYRESDSQCVSICSCKWGASNSQICTWSIISCHITFNNNVSFFFHIMDGLQFLVNSDRYLRSLFIENGSQWRSLLPIAIGYHILNMTTVYWTWKL
jgi:hypothetical protein